MSTPPSRELKVKISDDSLKGCYANTLVVSHTTEEFILDFVLALPPQAVINSRVILSPRHLKRIIQALRMNLQKYEKEHGAVSEAPEPGPPDTGICH